METISSFTMLSAQTNSLFHDLARQMCMSESALSILYTLRVFDNQLPLKDLVAYSGLPKQTVHSCIASMATKGYVRKEKKNLKTKDITLTDIGLDYCKKNVDTLIDFEKAFVRSRSEEEFSACLQFWQAYMAALRNQFQLDSR